MSKHNTNQAEVNIQKPQNSQNKKQNQLISLLKTAWRFYSALFSEAILGLILAAPFYAVLYFAGIEKVEISVNLPVLWGFATLLFIIQNLMFSKH